MTGCDTDAIKWELSHLDFDGRVLRRDPVDVDRALEKDVSWEDSDFLDLTLEGELEIVVGRESDV